MFLESAGQSGRDESSMLSICFVTSECTPFVKTGGLADVSEALPKAMARSGHRVKVFLPLYKQIDRTKHRLQPLPSLGQKTVTLAGRLEPFAVWMRKEPRLPLEFYFIDCPRYFHRDSIYTNDSDEDERFLLFQKATLRTLEGLRWAPDIFHCNDWQTALIPVFLKETYSEIPLFSRSATLLTIHNIGYKGSFSPETIAKAGLPMDRYFPGGPFEFFQTFSFLKAGIVYADVLSTVSPTYALEIQTPEYGSGLDGVLRTRAKDLFGILNGIDTRTWNPRTDPFIPFHYSARRLQNKARNKAVLIERTQPSFDCTLPTIGLVSRLAYQKGVDLLETVLPAFVDKPVQWIFLGTGEERYEAFLRQAAERYPHRVHTCIGFNNELAHLITAGCDLFLMPSRYEPCGLNQMYSLNYGTVPVVRKTGGLADTVIDIDENPDRGNGFAFVRFSPEALIDKLHYALRIFVEEPARWRQIMLRGMSEDFSWDRSARQYVELYQRAVSKKQASQVLQTQN